MCSDHLPTTQRAEPASLWPSLARHTRAPPPKRQRKLTLPQTAHLHMDIMDEEAFKQRVLEAHIRYTAQHKNNLDYEIFDDFSPVGYPNNFLHLDLSDKVPIEKSCIDLDTLLARYSAFGMPNSSLDDAKLVYTPICGPSRKTRWAREHDVSRAVELGLFAPSLPAKVSMVGKGENHWVQPDDYYMSDEEDLEMDDTELDADAMPAPFVTAGKKSLEELYGAMDLDEDKDDASSLDGSVDSDRSDLTEEDDEVSGTDAALIREELDEEMMDVDDEVIHEAPSAHADMGDTPSAAAGCKTPPYASTSTNVSCPTSADVLCPPKLRDIEDAWTFIEHMAKCPGAPFQIQSGKNGTRKRSNWKKKHPIGELLVRAYRTFNAGPSTLLLNQDSLPFCQMGSVAPPKEVAVDLYLGSKVELTLIECMAYFTSHVSKRLLLVRLVRAGLSWGNIANAINMVRHLSGKMAFTHSRVSTRKRRADGGPIMEEEITATNTTDFTAQKWKNDKNDRNASVGIDYPLLALEHGLTHLVQGEDAGPLTRLMQLCKTHGKYRVMLSEAPGLLQEAGIAPKIEKPANGECPDKVAVTRIRHLLLQDRARVLNTRGPG
jgi:hypothetical protein